MGRQCTKKLVFGVAVDFYNYISPPRHFTLIAQDRMINN